MSKSKQENNRKKNDKRKVSIKNRVAALESRLDAITHTMGGQPLDGQASDDLKPTV